MRLSAGSRRSSPKKKGRGRAMAVNREVPSMATIYLKGRKAGLGITHRSLYNGSMVAERELPCLTAIPFIEVPSI